MRGIATALLTLILATVAFAGHQPNEIPLGVFKKGGTEIQLAAGASFGVVHQPDVNFVELDARYGWMLTSPSGGRILRGSWELLLGLTGGIIFEGPGDGLAACTLLLRYNFIQPGSKWVPYVQIGGGGAWNSIHDEGGAAAKLVGNDFTFHLHAALGVRCFISKRFALTGEFAWHHLSTADTSNHNAGFNGIGGTLGASWFF